MGQEPETGPEDWPSFMPPAPGPVQPMPPASVPAQAVPAQPGDTQPVSSPTPTSVTPGPGYYQSAQYPDTPLTQPPPYGQPPYGQNQPTYAQPYSLYPQNIGNVTPPPNSPGSWKVALILGIAVLLIVAGAIYRFVIMPDSSSTPTPMPTPIPTIIFSPTIHPTTQTPPPTTVPPSDTIPPSNASSQPPLGTYARERENLTAAEQTFAGNLHKGDCVNNPPSDDLSQGVATIDCSQPHTDQVMGFVDLSEGMPAISDSFDFEMSVAQRCNSLKATLPIPPGFDQGVSAVYPDEPNWDNGVRVALCWVPVFNTTWVGSAIDGTATKL